MAIKVQMKSFTKNINRQDTTQVAVAVGVAGYDINIFIGLGNK